MEKIGIITIVRGNNYGNVLQNFALQYTLSQLGFISETINCTASNTAHSFRRISRLYLGAALRTAKGKHHQFYTVRRTKAFVRFRESHISYSPFRTCAGQFPAQKVLGYDCFLFGSDQIWNLKFDFVRNERDLFFGAFTKDVPKIAYAASFGTSEIEPEYREFVFCNHCYLVNPRHIRGVSGYTLFIGTDQLQISHPKKKEFMQALNHYFGGGASI